MTASTSAASVGRFAARWGLALLVAVLPPGLNLAALVALWVMAATGEGRRQITAAALLSIIGVTGNVILYAAL